MNKKQKILFVFGFISFTYEVIRNWKFLTHDTVGTILVVGFLGIFIYGTYYLFIRK